MVSKVNLQVSSRPAYEFAAEHWAAFARAGNMQALAALVDFYAAEQNKALADRLALARSRLNVHSWHIAACDKLRDPARPCSCGRDTLLRGLTP